MNNNTLFFDKRYVWAPMIYSEVAKNKLVSSIATWKKRYVWVSHSTINPKMTRVFINHRLPTVIRTN
jgi:hypothetical protein